MPSSAATPIAISTGDVGRRLIGGAAPSSARPTMSDTCGSCNIMSAHSSYRVDRVATGVPPPMQQRKYRRNEDQGGDRRQHQAADDSTTKWRILLAALTEPERHRHHADDHRQGGHQ